jgi:hypothetical protein
MANRGIFLASESTGAITDTFTIPAEAPNITLSREIVEDSNSTTERQLFLECADDDTSTPTIEIKISLKYGNGWSDWVTIQAATAVPVDFNISSYDQSWWKKNQGVKFSISKVGAGAVTITNANWI